MAKTQKDSLMGMNAIDEYECIRLNERDMSNQTWPLTVANYILKMEELPGGLFFSPQTKRKELLEQISTMKQMYDNAKARHDAIASIRKQIDIDFDDITGIYCSSKEGKCVDDFVMPDFLVDAKKRVVDAFEDMLRARAALCDKYLKFNETINNVLSPMERCLASAWIALRLSKQITATNKNRILGLGRELRRELKNVYERYSSVRSLPDGYAPERCRIQAENCHRIYVVTK